MDSTFDANKLGTPVAIAKTAAAASIFNNEKDKVIGSAEVDVVGIRRENSTTSKRLKDITGFSFYSLGPVYAVTRIGFDIVGNYGNMAGFKGPRVLLQLRSRMFNGLGPWDTVLEGLPHEHMAAFRQFMATQSAMVGDTGIYWRFDEEIVSCPDPLGVDRLDITGPEDVARVSIFLPSGNQARYAVSRPHVPPMSITRVVPRSFIVAEGRAAFDARRKQGLVQT